MTKHIMVGAHQNGKTPVKRIAWPITIQPLGREVDEGHANHFRETLQIG